MRTSWKIVPVAGLMLLASGCADLTVDNLNDPDQERALAEPADVQTLIGTSFINSWNAQQWYDGLAMSFSTMTWEHGASWGNQGQWQLSEYPRTEWPNNPGWTYYGVLSYTWTQSYATAAAVAQGLKVINDGLEIILDTDDGQENQTARAQAFGHFALGYSLGTIALAYDRGFIVDENADLANLQLVDYAELMDAALGHFQTSIDIASANDFTLPDNWINGNPLTSGELVALAHSFMARYMAENARYPEERDGDPGTTAAAGWEVDWAAVQSHVDQGITEDFEIYQDFSAVWWDDIKIYGDILGTWSRANYHFWGMADTSGGYEAWMATPPQDRTEFVMVTPDQRYPQGTTVEEQRAAPGLYLINTDPAPFRAGRGTYYFSFYRNARYDYYGAAGWQEWTPAMNLEEMNLLKAEAIYRQNGATQAVADLINISRVGNGGLPPVTTAGVTEGPASCVPQMPDGTCGDLLEALKYEKRVENVHTHLGTWFMDSRGWGDLPEGTPVMAPIPAGELGVLELPVYTFGGVGENCSAGSDCVIGQTGGDDS